MFGSVYNNIKKRVCKICGKEKTISSFNINKGIYRRHTCKKCHNKKQREKHSLIESKSKEKTRMVKELFKKGLKRCSICGEIKNISDFYSMGGGSSRLRSACSVCIVLSTKEYKKNNTEKIHIRNAKNADINYIKRKKYREDNIEIIRIKEKTKVKHRKQKDPLYRLTLNLRRRLTLAVKEQNTCKGSHTMELIGCSPQELRRHIELLFKDGMSWENYGKSGWHLDHIRPCSSFNLANIEEQKVCFHYTNIQPLWAIENLRKSNKIL